MKARWEPFPMIPAGLGTSRYPHSDVQGKSLLLTLSCPTWPHEVLQALKDLDRTTTIQVTLVQELCKTEVSLVMYRG